MTLSRILSKTLKFLSKHSGIILSVTAGACTIGAVVATANAATKTIEKTHKQKQQDIIDIIDRTVDQGREVDIHAIVETTENDIYKLNTLETIKLWSPAIVLTSIALLSIIFNHKINTKRQAALVAACASSATMFNAYRNANVSVNGKDAEDKIISSIIKSDNTTFNIADEFSRWDIDPNETVTFYDGNIGGYFETTPFKVLSAIYHLNRVVLTSGYITLETFYDFLGIVPDYKHADYCKVYGWDYESMYEVDPDCVFFDMDISRHFIGDDMVVYEFLPPFSPVPVEFVGDEFTWTRKEVETNA